MKAKMVVSENAVKMCFNSNEVSITLYEDGDVDFHVKTVSRRGLKKRWMYKRIKSHGNVMDINHLIAIVNKMQAGELGEEQ